MRLEVFHTDPNDLMECFDLPPGTGISLEHYPVTWDGTHWIGPDGEIGTDPQFLERFGHIFRLRLAKPMSRIEKSYEMPLWVPLGIVLYALVAAWLIATPPWPELELIEIRDTSCGFLIERPTPKPKPPQSYEPLEVAANEPRAPMPGYLPERPIVGVVTTVDLEWGHPLALQVDAAVKARQDELALCFRSSGAAGVRRAGTLFVDATVLLNGSMSDVRVTHDDYGVDALSTCVGDVFAEVQVPGPPDEVAIHYPVRFSIPT